MAFLLLTNGLEPILRDRVLIHSFFSHYRKYNRRNPAPRQLPPSSVSSLIDPPVRTADQHITFSHFSYRSASNHRSSGTLPASLPDPQPNDSRGPELAPSVTMSPVASTLVNTIPNILHTVDTGFRVLPTSSDMLEWDEPPGSTSKFHQRVQAGSSIPGPTPSDELSDRLKRCKDRTISHSNGICSSKQRTTRSFST